MSNVRAGTSDAKILGRAARGVLDTCYREATAVVFRDLPFDSAQELRDFTAAAGYPAVEYDGVNRCKNFISAHPSSLLPNVVFTSLQQVNISPLSQAPFCAGRRGV